MKFTFAPESRPLEGFTLKRAIYRGGFGEVYYGVSDAGREVALKLLQHNSDVELRGVQQCLNLSHPNLVTIFDVRKDADGDHWIVMEYVSGETLEAVIQKHPSGMPVEQVLRWLTGIARGVGFLHERRIVHRDLKPGNIFLAGESVKVGDVGLSKMMSPSKQSAHTQSVGTVYYMAPEVAKGKYGPAVDIYATGVILYEMLTGNLPFDGESTGEILMKHLTELPDLNRIPAPLRPVLRRALEKDPLLRQQSMAQLLREFEAAATGRQVEEQQRSSAAAQSSNSMQCRKGRPQSLWGQYCFDVGHFIGASGLSRSRLLIPCLVIVTAIIASRAGMKGVVFGWGGVIAVTFIMHLLWRTLSPLNMLEPSHLKEQAGPLNAGNHRGPPPLIKDDTGIKKRAARHHVCATAAMLPVFISLLTGLLAWARPSMFEMPNHDAIDHGMVGFFALSTLLAGWGLVIFLPHRMQLPRRMSERWRAAIVGWAVGLMVASLGSYLMVDFSSKAHHLSDAVTANIGRHPLSLSNQVPTLTGFAVFFASWFWLRNWSMLISPQREHRFSMLQVIWTVGTAWLVTRVFAFPVELGLAWASVLACSLQLAAPWDPSPRPKYIQH